MKKIIIIALIVVLATLTGCTNSSKSSKGIDLELDFKHMNKKVYNAHINLSNDDKVIEQGDTNSTRIENKNKNYILDITLDTESKDAYKQFKTSAKENNELFKEVKFGKYKGYYSDDNGDLYGYVLLDDSDPTFNVFVMFSLYLNDESSKDSDVKTIYKSSEVQNILNNIEFKTSK
jgi:hypothetical protein